jgi:hypothetical protein
LDGLSEAKKIIIASVLDELMGSFLTCSLRQVKEDEMGRACRTTGEKMNAYMILVGKPKGKRSLARPRRRWVANIKMDLRELGRGGMDWIHLAEDRDQWRALVNMLLNLWVQYIFGKFLSSCTIGGFSRRAHRHEVR